MVLFCFDSHDFVPILLPLSPVPLFPHEQYYHVRIGVAVGLFIAEELVLAGLSVMLVSYLPVVRAEVTGAPHSNNFLAYKSASSDLEGQRNQAVYQDEHNEHDSYQ